MVPPLVVCNDHSAEKTVLLDPHCFRETCQRMFVLYQPGRKNSGADALSCSLQASASTWRPPQIIEQF